MTLTRERRTVHVEQCMGTVFGIDIRDPGNWTEAVVEVISLLHRVDAVFSTYRPDSDLSRYRRGELTLADADRDLTAVLHLCAQMQAESSGYFSARWRDGIDPTGLVKGWAIEQASQLLRVHGSRNHAINGGGDIQTAGEAHPGQPWRIAIAHPIHRERIAAVVSGRDLAVATSGTAERGRHIINPFTGRPAEQLVSATVVGASLTRVDAYATAAFVMGPAALQWLQSTPDHEALLVHADGTTGATRSGMWQFPAGTGTAPG